MDFWDLFIKSEELSNIAALEVINQTVPDLRSDIDQYKLLIYTDFIELQSIDDLEFTAAVALLDNIDKLTVELSPAAIVILYKFYSMIFDSFEEVGEQLYKILGIKSARFVADSYLVENYQESLNTYSNFSDTEYLEELNFESPSGKVFCFYGNKIIVIYLKEGEELE